MIKLSFLIICSTITFMSFLFLNNKSEDKELTFTKLTLENIEALASYESATDSYWCCGNTDTCASGPGYQIKGKLKNHPC